MTNKEIVLNFYRDVWNAHDVTPVPQYVREDYKQHNPNGRPRQSAKPFAVL